MRRFVFLLTVNRTRRRKMARVHGATLEAAHRADNGDPGRPAF
jgi:hypothetical protein